MTFLSCWHTFADVAHTNRRLHAVGAMNAVLLAAIWLQMAHLVVAEMFWILLVLASTDLLFRPSRHSIFLKAI
jgi:hypothetical protein